MNWGSCNRVLKMNGLCFVFIKVRCDGNKLNVLSFRPRSILPHLLKECTLSIIMNLLDMLVLRVNEIKKGITWQLLSNIYLCLFHHQSSLMDYWAQPQVNNRKNHGKKNPQTMWGGGGGGDCYENGFSWLLTCTYTCKSARRIVCIVERTLSK